MGTPQAARRATPPRALAYLRLTPRGPFDTLPPTIFSPLLPRFCICSATKAESNFHSVGAMNIQRPEGPPMSYWLKTIGSGHEPCPEDYALKYNLVDFPGQRRPVAT